MEEGALNDLLECSVCLEKLDTSSKVLPCQHTFCKKCLEEIVSMHKELHCPECRVLVDVKIEELPPNVLLMRILEGMRNAALKKRNAAPNRMKVGHFAQATMNEQQVTPAAAQNPVSSHASNVPQLDITTQAHQAPKPIAQPYQPYAKALYDYLSIEPGDLGFKKGDIILLHKKIDTNYYHGECGGSQGVFPLIYVQVITPLPSYIPQCKALYDFRRTNDDEERCLTFKEGEVITVICRVDEYWAEGKLADRIGIFPLAFVELNRVAGALMKLSTNMEDVGERNRTTFSTTEEAEAMPGGSRAVSSHDFETQNSELNTRSEISDDVLKKFKMVCNAIGKELTEVCRQERLSKFSNESPSLKRKHSETRETYSKRPVAQNSSPTAALSMDDLVECPTCHVYFEVSDIQCHSEECGPSTSHGRGHKETCPICGMCVPAETAVDHAAKCALERFG